VSGELASLDATAQAELIRSGEAKPLELVDAAIDRIERVNGSLNAVITPLFERARERAGKGEIGDGPFRGVPFLVKDLDLSTAGDPYHCGMKFLRDAGHVADHDTYLAARFAAAGLVNLGKTNTPELGLNVTTEPAAYGPCRNPWDTARSSGGSSGGSAAAVAAGMVPVAHASDGGGSIRIPASECGLVGLKPSRGRISAGPDYGEYWNGLVTSHVVSRSLRDSAAILDCVCEPMPGDPYFLAKPARTFAGEIGTDPGRLRIGLMAVLPAGLGELHPQCRIAVERTGKALETLGHHVETAHPAALDEFFEAAGAFATVVNSWTAAALEEWGRTVGKPVGEDDVEPTTWQLAESGRSLAVPAYIEALKWISRYTRRMAAWWTEGFDLLVTPTIAIPPPEIGALTAAGEGEDPAVNILNVIPYTPPFNMTGQPAISLPLHWTPEGLPVGVQLVAAYAREDLLLRVSAQLEQALPWHDRRPPVLA
jgi:amidase